MMKPLRAALVLPAVAALGACMAPMETTRTVQTAAAPASAKLIRAEPGGTYLLPDGTRVLRDGAGGFTLPNGAYVSRTPAGDLMLPTGALCRPSGPNFICP